MSPPNNPNVNDSPTISTCTQVDIANKVPAGNLAFELPDNQQITFSFNENDNVNLLDDKNGAKVEVSEIKNFSFHGEIDLEKVVGKQDPKLFAINFFTAN